VDKTAYFIPAVFYGLINAAWNYVNCSVQIARRSTCWC